VAFQNGRIINIDATMIAQEPKLMPHAAAMKLNIAEALGVPAKKNRDQGDHQRMDGFHWTRRRDCGDGCGQHRPAGTALRNLTHR